jgi:glycosyltransferase involved in cell wall biosynthesis
MRPKISVAICTHNPRRSYLQQTLDGLRAQTLPTSEWELMLIDNRSDEPLAGWADISWHSAARVIREEELGLTPARLRALREAEAELLVFVDDDNVLALDYLAKCADIDEQWPMLGAWGAGVLRGEFETPPPQWMIPHLWYVTVHEVPKDRWSNQSDMWAFPAGAGLAVRRSAAAHYVEALQEDDFRRALDRRGAELSSCGDMDLLWEMTRHGWGVGRFVRLTLRHLIGANRLEENYFRRLVTNMWQSNRLLQYVHDSYRPEGKPSMLEKLRYRRYLESLSERERWIIEAKDAGLAKAQEMILAMERSDVGRTKRSDEQSCLERC